MKSRKLLLLFWTTTVVLFSGTNLSQGLRLSQPAPPKVKILKFTSDQDYYQVNSTQVKGQIVGEKVTSIISNGERIYNVPTSVYQVQFLCLASYPVEFVPDFESFKYNYESVLIIQMELRRFARELLDSSSFKYTATLLMHRERNKLTGRYLCRSTQNNSLYTSIYTFWEAKNLHQYLVLSHENITLVRKENSNNTATTNTNTINGSSTNKDESITLPCTVSTADVTPVLLKFTQEPDVHIANKKAGLIVKVKQPQAKTMKTTELRTNSSIRYDPKIGFVLTGLPNPSGTYKCVTNQSSWEDDYLIIQVPKLKADQPESPKPIISNNQTYNGTTSNSTNTNITINGTTSSISMRHPTNPNPSVVVKSQPTLLYNPERKEMVCCNGLGKGYGPTIYHYFCDNPTFCNFLSYTPGIMMAYEGRRQKQRKNGCTSYKVLMHSNGNIRCIGPDFDLHRNYVLSYEALVEQRFSRYRAHYAHIHGVTWTPSINQSDGIPFWNTWNEINPDEMLVVLVQMTGHDDAPIYGYNSRHNQHRRFVLDHGIHGEGNIEPIYEGQDILVQCRISPYYFSSGIKWALKYRNGTVKFLQSIMETRYEDLLQMVSSDSDVVDNNLNLDDLYVLSQHVDFLELKADASIASVVCMAPIWNSTLWVNKPYNLHVNKSRAPEVINMAKVNSPLWYLNDTKQSIECVATGLPPPTFTWSLENQTLKNGTNMDIITKTAQPPLDLDRSENGTEAIFSSLELLSVSVLTISRVSYSSHGNYTCEVSNLAGIGSKFLIVQVQERSSWRVQYAIIVGFVITAVLLIGLGTLLWKLKLEQKNMRGIPNGLTENSGIVGDNYHTDVNNQTFDPTLLNGGLIR